MAIQFKKATKHESKLRLSLTGPSGSGKTYTALAIGCALGERVAVIDSEHGSASKYADKFSFDVLELDECSLKNYIEALKAAADAKYDVIIVDSLSHAWAGKGGALEQVDRITKASNSGNSYVAWRDVTPLQNQMIDTIVSCPAHVIATMRSKTEYVIENSGGKMLPKKVGMAAVQKEGMEYEFDVAGDLTLEHEMIVTKTRYSEIEGTSWPKAGKNFADAINQWLAGKPLAETIAEIDEIGARIYGDDWLEKRAGLVLAVSQNATNNVHALPSKQLDVLLSGLNKQLAIKTKDAPANGNGHAQTQLDGMTVTRAPKGEAATL